jgi:hypothetical protein
MTIPTLSELYNTILNDIKGRLNIPSIIGKTVFAAFAAVQAAKLKILYLLAANIYKNIFVDTADTAMLERFGLVKLGRLKTPAVAGVYDIDVTGEIAAVIPAGTTYKSLDTSTSPDQLFILDTQFTFVATTGTISVRALTLGPDARLEILDQLQLTAPIANVNSFAEVSAVTTTPIAAETDEDYRKEIIRAYQTESQGGARGDYRTWSQDAAGVQEVYPYVKDGDPGIIDLYVEATVADSTDGKGTPSASLLLDVEDVVELDPDTSKPINERGRRPMSAFEINFTAITPLNVDIVITNLSDTSFLTPIKDAFAAFLADVRPFVDGADSPNDLNKGKLYESDAYTVVRDVIGIDATFDSLVLKVATNPVTVYEFTDGDIPFANSVTSV